MQKWVFFEIFVGYVCTQVYGSKVKIDFLESILGKKIRNFQKWLKLYKFYMFCNKIPYNTQEFSVCFWINIFTITALNFFDTSFWNM